MPALTLVAFGAILAVAAFGNGGTDLPLWRYCAASLGIVGFAHGLASALKRKPIAFRGAAAGLLALTVGWCVLQLLPLPPGLLRILSPSSLSLFQALEQTRGVRVRPSISVEPSATLDATLSLVACIVVFAVGAGLSLRSTSPSRRRLAIPLVGVGLLESVFGILQTVAGSRPGGVSGTYQNHNHFAGLLEMCLPFAAMFAFAAWRCVSRRQGAAWTATLAACGWIAAATLMLAAVGASLSRMGFAASLAGLLVAGSAAVVAERRLPGASPRHPRPWPRVAGVVAAVLIVALLLPSAAFIERFGQAAGTSDLPPDARFEIWRDTLHLIAAFPLAGCGFGAFQSANMRYQTATPLMTVNFAHNDYLQLLAELGVVGFVPLLIVAALVYRAAFRNLRGRRDPYLAAACLGALAAISLHSLVDFNLYKPANAMVVAWIAGISIGVAARPNLLQHDQ